MSMSSLYTLKNNCKKRKYNKPVKDEKYKRDNFICRVKITQIKKLGKATPSKTFECKDRKKVVPKVYDNERHYLLAKALRFANHHIFIGGINVISVDKETEIKQEISKLFQGFKKDNSGDDDDADDVEVDHNVQENSRNITDNQHPSWEEILEHIVKHNHSKMKQEEI